MLRMFAAAAVLAGVVAPAPAQATLNMCDDPVDVACYSGPHEMFCQVYVRELCINVRVPSLDGPVCAFHPICDDIDELINSGTTRRPGS